MDPFRQLAGICLLLLSACSDDKQLSPTPVGLSEDESQWENIGRAFWHYEAEKFDPEGPFDIQVSLLCRFDLRPTGADFGEMSPQTGLAIVIEKLNLESPIPPASYKLPSDVRPTALPNLDSSFQRVIGLSPKVTGKFLLRFDERPGVIYAYDLEAPGPASVKAKCAPPDSGNE